MHGHVPLTRRHARTCSHTLELEGSPQVHGKRARAGTMELRRRRRRRRAGGLLVAFVEQRGALRLRISGYGAAVSPSTFHHRSDSSIAMKRAAMPNALIG